MSGEENGSDLTNGEIARTLKRLDDGQKQIVLDQREGQRALIAAQAVGNKAVMDQLTLMRSEFIHRTEFDMQNRIYEAAFADLKADLKADHDAIHAPETGVVAQIGALDKRGSYQRGRDAVLAALLGAALAVLYSIIQSGKFFG